MKKLLGCLIILCISFPISHAQSPAAHLDLSIDQQTNISEIVANLESRPLTDVNFVVALGVVVPQEVVLHPLPPDAEALVPQLRGTSYLVVEELVAIVDTNSRKIVTVMQRMRRQNNGSGR